VLTMTEAIDRLKGKCHEVLPEQLIEQTCADLDLRFRRRTLTPVVTTYLFLEQILHGNPAVGELQHLSKLEFTDSAYCQARGRLPVRYFRRLQRAVTGRCRRDDHLSTEELWHGHRVFLADGSSYSMADTPELQDLFGQPSGQALGCGFPTAHLLTLFDAQSGWLLKAIPAAWNTHDLSQVALLHPELQAGDVLVGDTAFCSYAHLALCRQRSLHGLFRGHQRTIFDFRPGRPHVPPGIHPKREHKGMPRSRWIKRLGKHDQLVEYFKPEKKPEWMSAVEYAQLPASLVVRELRVTVRIPGRRTKEIYLVTTLVNRRYSARALARLFGQRWQVETNLRHLKQTLKLDVLRCTTVPGIVKELEIFVLAYNLVRRVMREASRRQKVLPDRISFVDALRWLRHALPGEELRHLKVNPDRPHRVEPRVRKRRPKQFPLMKKPRAVLRKLLLQQNDAA
jgi:hypothetical protein